LETRKLGRSGIEVSALALGCWAMGGGPGWGDQDEALSIATVHAALDCGINFFDTAEGYGNGRSEEVLGKALVGRRQEAIVATKISPNHAAPLDVRPTLEASLRRLRTDVVDLYIIHWPVTAHPVADTLAVLQDLKAEGKIRAIGVSNHGPQQLGEVFESGVQIDANQVCYNVLSRAVEMEVLPLCRQHQVSVTAYMPLFQGILADKYRAPDEVPPFRARTRHFRGDRPRARHGGTGLEAETFAALDAIRAIAAELGQPMANVALAWAMAREGVTSVLAGARTPQQVERNVRAAALPLLPQVIARLDQVTEDLKRALGPNIDYWQGTATSRSR
jgi:myo-inositol catabolism protein IolS